MPSNQALGRELVKNIVQASDLIFFTAAPKGQGGHDHINEQEPEFWINLFSDQGYGFLREDTNLIREKLFAKKAIFWLAENFLIFKKRQSY